MKITACVKATCFYFYYSYQTRKYYIDSNLFLSMHYLKQTAAKVRDHLFSEKILNEIQNNFLFQLLVLSSVIFLSYLDQTLFE